VRAGEHGQDDEWARGQAGVTCREMTLTLLAAVPTVGGHALPACVNTA
jgi:hypothetical protein